MAGKRVYANRPRVSPRSCDPLSPHVHACTYMYTRFLVPDRLLLISKDTNICNDFFITKLGLLFRLEMDEEMLDEIVWDYFSLPLLFFFLCMKQNTIFQFWSRYGVVGNNERIVWDFCFPLTRFVLSPLDVKYRGNYELWSRIQFQYRLSPISVQSLFQYSHSSKWISQSLFISLAVIFPIFRYKELYSRSFYRRTKIEFFNTIHSISAYFFPPSCPSLYFLPHSLLVQLKA